MVSYYYYFFFRLNSVAAVTFRNYSKASKIVHSVNADTNDIFLSMHVQFSVPFDWEKWREKKQQKSSIKIHIHLYVSVCTEIKIESKKNFFCMRVFAGLMNGTLEMRDETFVDFLV